MLVKLRQDDISYEPGDHLGVFPTNSADKVDIVCESCIFDKGVEKNTVVSLQQRGRPPFKYTQMLLP